MVTLKKIGTLIVFFMCMYSVKAQDVKVLSSGQGISKDEATKLALVNALEETYGMFISSSTTIENDFIKSDEITTLTQGTIKEYEVLNVSQISDNSYIVLVETIVSLEKLSSYCQNKGIEAIVDGKTFGMNVKIKEFRLQNENKIIKNLCSQIKVMEDNFYDFNMKVCEPTIVKDRRIKIDKNKYQTLDYKYEGKICIVLEITTKRNDNSKNVEKLCQTTLEALCLSKEERKEYDKMGLSYKDSGWLKGLNSMYLRNEANVKLLNDTYNEKHTRSLFSFEIIEGTNAKTYFKLLGANPFNLGGRTPYGDNSFLYVMTSWNRYEKPFYVLLFFSKEDIMDVKEIVIKPYAEAYAKNYYK